MSEAPLAEALELRAFGATHPGRRRPHNEDHFAVRDDLLLFVVADGAGGHNAGEVASALAVRSICNYVGATVRATYEKPEIDRFGIPTGARRLSAAVQKANKDCVEISRTQKQHRGMGTTVVAAVFSPRSGLLHVAHVGDSRCYRLRGGHLEQLTQDHSLLTDVLEQRPELDDSQLRRLPRNVVTRALGIDERLRVSVRSYQVVPGDRYLLCTDGLSSPVDAGSIAETLARTADAGAAVPELIEKANAAGGPDNVTAVIVDCAGGHARALPASASVPPPSDEDLMERESDPELLILGIEEVDVDERTNTASDGLLDALRNLMGVGNRK